MPAKYAVVRIHPQPFKRNLDRSTALRFLSTILHLAKTAQSTHPGNLPYNPQGIRNRSALELIPPWELTA